MKHNMTPIEELGLPELKDESDVRVAVVVRCAALACDPCVVVVTASCLDALVGPEAWSFLSHRMLEVEVVGLVKAGLIDEPCVIFHRDDRKFLRRLGLEGCYLVGSPGTELGTIHRIHARYPERSIVHEFGPLYGRYRLPKKQPRKTAKGPARKQAKKRTRQPEAVDPV